MQIFLDSANLEEIQKAKEEYFIDGVTTNPSLASKEKLPFKKLVKEICDIVQGPVSAEVIATDTEGIIREARELAEISPHVVVKVPLIPSGLKALKILSQEGIKVNVTLCFSPIQALFAAKLGAYYISPFVGRLDYRGHEGMGLIEEIIEIYSHYGFSTQVLVASIRHPQHVKQAALLGADICTMPFSVLSKLLSHPLTDQGLEVFLRDARNLQWE